MLTEAVRYGHTEIASRLLDSGATTDDTDDRGWAALHYAASVDDLEMTELLIFHDADVNQRTPYKYIPLHISAREGNEAVSIRLVEAGSDIFAEIDVGLTPKDLAEQYPEIQDMLDRAASAK